MARRILCASWLALLMVVAWGGSAWAQSAPPTSPSPYAYPAAGDPHRRQTEQLWFRNNPAPSNPSAVSPSAQPQNGTQMTGGTYAPPPAGPSLPAQGSFGVGGSPYPQQPYSPGVYSPVAPQPAPSVAAPPPNYAPQPAYAGPPNRGFQPQQPYPPNQPNQQFQARPPHMAYAPSQPAPTMNASPPAMALPPGVPPEMHSAPHGPLPQPQPGTQFPMQAPPGAAQPSLPHAGARPKGELFEEAEVVARVGDEVILAGDLTGLINPFIEANRDKIPPEREAFYRQRLMQQVLESEIQTKLVYLDFLRQIRAKGADQTKITEIHNRVYEQFDEKRLPDLLEKAEVASPAELDAKLREQGSSLMKQKRQFAEKVMSQQWLRESGKVDFEPKVTHGQMLDYYYAHDDEYAFPAKARWEHLMARFSEFPNKAAAYEAIRAMGNEVYLGGAPLWAVAKRSSHGVTASDGGQFESTTQGSLKSKTLDEAVFSLELNKLSPILEDEEGFHIVRVLERTEAGRTSFESAQAEIKEKIKKEQIQKQVDAYLAELRRKTPVWTAFDEEREEQAKKEAERASAFQG